LTGNCRVIGIEKIEAEFRNPTVRDKKLPERRMTLSIFGAGAIGVYLAGRLANAGVPTRLIARPATAASLQQRENGLVLTEGGQTQRVVAGDTLAIHAVGEPLDPACKAASLLILTVKSQQLLSALPDIAPFVGPDTLIACLQNGIPWWYFYGLPGKFANRPLASLDPENRLAATLPPERVLGGVILKSVEMCTPGHVIANAAQGDAFIFGAPLPGDLPAGVEILRAAFAAAGLNPCISADIRRDMWQKLLGNALFNPISALADADLARMLQFSPSRELIRDGMEEVLAVARAHGVTLEVSINERLARAASVGAFHTSMLQDKRQHRPLEIEGILGALLELARLTQTPTPRLATLYAVTALLSQGF
jgi:2-dehydropantoate 2-reductase